VTATTDRKVATVLSVVSTTTSTGVRTAAVTLRAVGAGSGVDALDATGWVLVKAGDELLAQVRLEAASATATWSVPAAASGAMTISYTGDSQFAPSLRTLAL
jgi:hypothetical protein